MNLSKSEQIALPGASSEGAGVGESPPVVVFLLQVQGPAAIESPCCGSRAKAPSNSCQTASDSARVLDGCAEAAAARQPVLSVPYIGLALDDRPERERGESRSMTVRNAKSPSTPYPVSRGSCRFCTIHVPGMSPDDLQCAQMIDAKTI